jgi:hypothetical protein
MEVKQLARKIFSSDINNHDQLTETDIETLTSYVRELGEYEDGMDLEEIACIIILYEIQKEKAQKTTPTEDHAPLSVSRADSRLEVSGLHNKVARRLMRGTG